MRAPSPTTTRSSGGLGHHEVVLDADDGGAAAAQHAAAQDPHRLGRRRAVEGGRRGRAPVDDERLVVVVARPRDGRCSAPRGRRAARVSATADAAVRRGGRCAAAVAAAAAARSMAWSMSSRPKTRPSYCVSRAVRRLAAWNIRASRSKRPAASSASPTSADLAMRPAGQTLGLHDVGAVAGLLELLVDPVDVGLLDGDLARDVVGHGRAVAARRPAAEVTARGSPVVVDRCDAALEVLTDVPASLTGAAGRRGNHQVYCHRMPVEACIPPTGEPLVGRFVRLDLTDRPTTPPASSPSTPTRAATSRVSR